MSDTRPPNDGELRDALKIYGRAEISSPILATLPPGSGADALLSIALVPSRKCRKRLLVQRRISETGVQRQCSLGICTGEQTIG